MFHRRGYFQTECIVCGGKALYHVGGDGYCRTHRDLAVARRQHFGARRALWAKAKEEERTARDRADLRHISARQTNKFG